MSKNNPSIAQLTQRHRFTVIGRTASIVGNIETLLLDKYIVNGPYKKALALALSDMRKANDLVRSAEINIGAK